MGPSINRSRSMPWLIQVVRKPMQMQASVRFCRFWTVAVRACNSPKNCLVCGGTKESLSGWWTDVHRRLYAVIIAWPRWFVPSWCRAKSDQLGSAYPVVCSLQCHYWALSLSLSPNKSDTSSVIDELRRARCAMQLLTKRWSRALMALGSWILGNL